MPGFGGLAGLGNALTGYNQEYDQITKQLGDVAFGRTLQALSQQSPTMPGMQPQGMPQQPGMGGMPPQQQGQQPMPGGGSPPPPPTPPPAPQGGPGPSQQPASPQSPVGQGQAGMGQQPPQQPPMQPTGYGRQGQLDWRAVIQKVQQANPQAPPQVLAAAVNRFLPLMNQQSQMEWKQIELQLREQGLQNQQNLGQQRIEQGQERVDQGSQRLQQAQDKEAEREKEFSVRETRLETEQQVKADQGYQRLQMQKDAIQNQINRTNANQYISQWRAIVDAQHKRALEIIQSNSGFSGLSPEDKKKLLDDENQKYEKEIADMRDRIGRTTPTGGGSPEPEKKTEQRAPESGAAPGSPVKVQTPDEAAKLAPGTKYITPDGQTYTR